VALGAAAHPETPRGEVGALGRAVASGEGVSDDEIDARVWRAFEASRQDLARDVVRLGDASGGEDRVAAARIRRWGSVRSLELNAFVAAFTREGMHPVATAATRQGRDSGAMRFALAVAQAALSLPAPDAVESSLEQDVARTETALPALIANLAAALR
jgi:hypothetical protein